MNVLPRLKLALLCCVWLGAAETPVVGAAAVKPVSVHVRVAKVPDTRGHLVLEFYAKTNFLKKPVHREVIPLAGIDVSKNINVEVQIRPGDYGIGAFHDQDGDKQIDRNWVGIPDEPYGWSHKVHPKWAPPVWEKVKFAADGTSKPSKPIEIIIRPW